MRRSIDHRMNRQKSDRQIDSQTDRQTGRQVDGQTKDRKADSIEGRMSGEVVVVLKESCCTSNPSKPHPRISGRAALLGTCTRCPLFAQAAASHQSVTYAAMIKVTHV